jgi:hypothetical protein
MSHGLVHTQHLYHATKR